MNNRYRRKSNPAHAVLECIVWSGLLVVVTTVGSLAAHRIGEKLGEWYSRPVQTAYEAGNNLQLIRNLRGAAKWQAQRIEDAE